MAQVKSAETGTHHPRGRSSRKPPDLLPILMWLVRALITLLAIAMVIILLLVARQALTQELGGAEWWLKVLKEILQILSPLGMVVPVAARFGTRPLYMA